MAQQQQERHPIYDDIKRGDTEAVQQRVRADAAVLEERAGAARITPLLWAIIREEPAIALWLIQDRGLHDIDTANADSWTALHYASHYGPLEVVQALVAASANPAASDVSGTTPLVFACSEGHTSIVAFLLQLPAVKATIDHISQFQSTALSLACRDGHQPVVQLLLDVGADPTIPAGERSPINRAISYNNHAVAALLRRTIAEAACARECVARVGKGKGLCEDLCVKLRGFLVHAWAEKGRAGVL